MVNLGVQSVGSAKEQASSDARGSVARRRRARSAAKSPLLVWSARILLLIAFFGLWELASEREWLDPTLVGQPSGIVTALQEYVSSGRAATSGQATGIAVLAAFVIGSVSGTVVGLILGINPFLDAVIGFFLTPLNSVPRIALAPLFIAWFGLTANAKVALAVTIVFFILAENSRSAVRSVDPDLMVMSRVVGLGRIALLWKVVLPSAIPAMFAGLRLTFTYSLLGVIASEMIAAASGVGQDLVFYGSSYQINGVFAILILLLFAGMIVNAVFAVVERRLLRWQNA